MSQEALQRCRRAQTGYLGEGVGCVERSRSLAQWSCVLGAEDGFGARTAAAEPISSLQSLSTLRVTGQMPWLRAKRPMSRMQKPVLSGYQTCREGRERAAVAVVSCLPGHDLIRRLAGIARRSRPLHPTEHAAFPRSLPPSSERASQSVDEEAPLFSMHYRCHGTASTCNHVPKYRCTSPVAFDTLPS